MKTFLLRKSLLVASLLSCTGAAFALNVPKPMAIDIDDLGWKEGWDLHEAGGPYRLGLPRGRVMTLPDYEVLVYISKATGVRLKCLFIMSEFDRSNICARYPTTNEKGSDWDNSALVSDNDFAVMNYVKENAAHIEFGLHGVRHEFWDAQTRAMSRAEWADNGKKRPYNVLWGHLEYFKKLIDQYGLDFPRSVRTAAANYYYNPNDPEDSGGPHAGLGGEVRHLAAGPGIRDRPWPHGTAPLRRHCLGRAQQRADHPSPNGVHDQPLDQFCGPGYAYLVLPKLEQKQYTLTFATGPSTMPTCVWNDGTYNVEDFQSGAENAVVELEMYGTQQVRVKLRFEPRAVSTNTTDLQIREWRYEAPFLTMLVRGRNIQGQRGVITIRSKPAP